MSDDLCECIWGHELAMRRLLNFIRNSQNNCTDNECFDDNFRRQSPEQNVLMMTLFFVAALFLYYCRPRTRRINDDLSKPGGSNGQSGAPPSPPSAMS